MTDVLLLILFYLYAGLAFGMSPASSLQFPKLKWWTQVVFWPVLFVVYDVRRIRESDFGWFVRYGIFKLTH